MGNSDQDHVARGLLLYESHNYDRAEKEFALALVQDPEDARARSLLAICLLLRQEVREALHHVNEAIKFDPQCADAFHVKSIIELSRNHPEQARALEEQAIQLEPFYAPYFGHLSEIYFVMEKLNESLGAAEHGLSIDPENINCINNRARVLVRLGRASDAEESMRFALTKEPENALSHTNLGWILLREGRIEEAMEHLKTGLRLDPNSDFAREGVVEAMKSRNRVYHVLLKATLAIYEMDARLRLVLLAILLFFAPLRAFLIPVLILLWSSDQLFNTILRFDPYGRLVLSEDQIRQSNFFIGLIAVVATLLLYAWMARVSLLPEWR